MLWPALLPAGADGFPFSTYPMFAADRGSVVAIDTVVALDADGEVHRLGPQEVGGGDEVMLAVEAVRRAVDGGEAAALCAEVAAAVDDPDLQTIEVRTEVRDAVADVRGTAEPIHLVVHASCPANEADG